jgi:hypothetical protein
LVGFHKVKLEGNRERGKVEGLSVHHSLLIIHYSSLCITGQEYEPGIPYIAGMGDVDVVSDLLRATMAAFPSSEFIQSLSHQYLVRGWLSKKQLQGLHGKASKVKEIPPGKLATLEAQIMKMPNRYRSELPETTALYEKDEHIGQLIGELLTKYPQHKRVLFLQAKYKNNEPLSTSETSELEKFGKLLLKK